MKKVFLAASFLLALLFLITGCNDSSDSQKTFSSSDPSATSFQEARKVTASPLPIITPSPEVIKPVLTAAPTSTTTKRPQKSAATPLPQKTKSSSTATPKKVTPTSKPSIKGTPTPKPVIEFNKKDVIITLTTGKKSYKIGEEIHVKATVTNKTGRTITVMSGSNGGTSDELGKQSALRLTLTDANSFTIPHNQSDIPGTDEIYLGDFVEGETITKELTYYAWALESLEQQGNYLLKATLSVLPNGDEYEDIVIITSSLDIPIDNTYTLPEDGEKILISDKIDNELKSALIFKEDSEKIKVYLRFNEESLNQLGETKETFLDKVEGFSMEDVTYWGKYTDTIILSLPRSAIVSLLDEAPIKSMDSYYESS